MLHGGLVAHGSAPAAVAPVGSGAVLRERVEVDARGVLVAVVRPDALALVHVAAGAVNLGARRLRGVLLRAVGARRARGALLAVAEEALRAAAEVRRVVVLLRRVQVVADGVDAAGVRLHRALVAVVRALLAAPPALAHAHAVVGAAVEAGGVVRVARVRRRSRPGRCTSCRRPPSRSGSGSRSRPAG